MDGWWAPGCQLHDNCCRLNTLFCWTVCNAVAPIAPLSDPLGEARNWTYTDYSWNIDTDYIGYSGCTCPGVGPTAFFYECSQ